MQAARQSQWRTPVAIVAIIALIISGSLGAVEIWEALQSRPSSSGSIITQSVLVSRGRITLVGNGSVAYANFTGPGGLLVSAYLNVSFTGVEAASMTRLSLLNEGQLQRFKSCNCIFYGNYSSVSTTWSSPLSHSYTAQATVPYSAKWILAFQHEPGNGNAENFDETITLTYTVVG